MDDYGGAFWGLWGPVGRVLEGPGGRWGAFWEALGGSWAVLEGLGAHFGGRWRHLTPTWQTNVTREVKLHFVPIPLPPFGGKMSPRGAPREPKWRPKGAKGPQNGAEEAPKWIKNASEAKLKICKNRQRVVPKSTFGGLEVEPKERKKDKKRASRKVKEGREAKLGSRGL